MLFPSNNDNLIYLFIRKNEKNVKNLFVRTKKVWNMFETIISGRYRLKSIQINRGRFFNSIKNRLRGK